jgi:hypothetical protein
LLYEQSCAFVFQDRWFAPREANSGEIAKKKLPMKIPCNPLIRLVSDERIQGNPRKSQGKKAGFLSEKAANQEKPNGSTGPASWAQLPRRKITL